MKLFHLATWTIDYFCFGLTIYVGSIFLGDVDFKGNALASFKLFLCSWVMFSDVQILREMFYLKFFPSSVISEKKSITFNPEVVFYMIKTRLFLYSAVAIGAYFGWMVLPYQGQFLKWIAIGWVEGFISGFIRDRIGMDIFHKWMHEDKKLYPLHKVHHKVAANVTCLNVTYFDYLDLFAENAIGLVAIIALKMLFLGQPVLWHSYMVQLNLDNLVHSCNPYSACFLNPILDSVCLANICHNLHHATQIEHYEVLPWRHLFSKESRQKDVDTYNKIMKTTISSM